MCYSRNDVMTQIIKLGRGIKLSTLMEFLSKTSFCAVSQGILQRSWCFTRKRKFACMIDAWCALRNAYKFFRYFFCKINLPQSKFLSPSPFFFCLYNLWVRATLSRDFFIVVTAIIKKKSLFVSGF